MRSKKILSEAVDNILSENMIEFSCAQLHHLLLKDLDLENGKEIITERGVALSPKQAADCINDYKRTAKFLGGINEAIKSREKERLSILYVGPGPFGTLLMPLLNRYTTSDFNLIHFLEINKESAETLKKTLSTFQFNWSNVKVFNQNAFEFASTIQYDLIICEAMYKGLTIEPQVALTDYLSHFLKPNGIFIPEKIVLHSSFSKLENEPSFENEIVTYPKRKSQKLIWSLQIPYELFSHKWEKLPEMRDGDELVIHTHVKVFGDHEIRSGESLITDPICIFSDFKESEQFRLNYIQDNSPKWGVELK